MQLTYGEVSIDFSTLPAKSQEALAKRGLTHFLGNEQAAKVSGWKAKFADENDGAEPGADEVQAKKAEYVANAVKALLAGEVGTATRGPAADPIESEMDRIAKREINAVLKANGAKFSGKGDERVVTFANGEKFTMDQLVERRLANADHAARIRKEAEKAIKAAAKQAEGVKSAGPLDVNAIG